MATGIVHKAMVYLGLTDDEYEEYDPYEDAAPVTSQPPQRRTASDPVEPGLGPVSVRTVTRGDAEPSNGGVTVTSRPMVRPVSTFQSPKVQVVAPHRFSDAQEIGDRFKSGQPVIVNLQNNERELARRMIDFCSGVTYGLGGSMDKVADQVFLLTPSNVEVSAEEKRRLEERGYSS